MESYQIMNVEGRIKRAECRVNFVMKRMNFILRICLVFIVPMISMCQDSPKPLINEADLEEFELLNLCHCNEYLWLRHYDYVAWKSKETKQNYLKEIENIEFGRYQSVRLHGQYFQSKYDSTLFIKKGASVYFGGNLNFKRLDSLYFEPIIQHYIGVHGKSETLPYLGFSDNNFFLDCFYKVKEIPLKQELELFIKLNDLEK